MNGTTSIKPSEDWHYGTVRVVLDHGTGQLVVMVASYLPDPGDDAGFDPVEADWLLMCNDLERRYGFLPNLGEPVFLSEHNMDAYMIPMPDAN